MNVGGSDICEGNKKLILGLVWQLMRFDTISLLEKLGGGKKVSDSDLIKWANDKTAGKGRITSFQDQDLADSRYVIFLSIIRLALPYLPSRCRQLSLAKWLFESAE